MKILIALITLLFCISARAAGNLCTSIITFQNCDYAQITPPNGNVMVCTNGGDGYVIADGSVVEISQFACVDVGPKPTYTVVVYIYNGNGTWIPGCGDSYLMSWGCDYFSCHVAIDCDPCSVWKQLPQEHCPCLN